MTQIMNKITGLKPDTIQPKAEYADSADITADKRRDKAPNYTPE